MALATQSGGKLKTLNDKCKIYVGGKEIELRILPEISDSKKATYADTVVIGRSTPIKTYSHSDNRTITMKMHFITLEESDLDKNLNYLRILESATYPRQGDPYLPPPVCKIDCGKGLGETPVCVVLDNYSVSFPTNVAWDKDKLLPLYFEVTTSWNVVYDSASLPNQEKILGSGV